MKEQERTFESPCYICGKTILQPQLNYSGMVKVKCKDCIKKEDDVRARKSRVGILKALMKVDKIQWTEKGVHKLAESNEETRKFLIDFLDLHSKFYLDQWLHGLRRRSENTLIDLIHRDEK